jgi:UDP-GlcNAc3NAcA epimerase
MKICTIIGARPQFIKAAAVSRAIASHNRAMQGHDSEAPTLNVEPRILNLEPGTLNEVIVHTGQHYDEGMSAIFFKELEIPEPAYNIGVGSGTHGKQTGEMLAAIEKLLMAEKPDWVLVYGDTNSTLAGALAAAKLHISVAHVEAGLRSFNRRMPEEINRVVTDHLSTVMFCPSQVSVDNLIVEGIEKGVSIVGDVMADALQFAAAKVSANSNILNRLGLQTQSYLLATVHRAENTDVPERLNNILSAFKAINQIIVFPVHPRTRKLLQSQGYQPPKNVRLVDPLGYFDIIALEKSARIIMTDSGGMQKEAYWLKVPCITLRDETEWVETVEVGWNILTGADQKRICSAIQNFSPPTEHPVLYGNGRAAEKIIESLCERSV